MLNVFPFPIPSRGPRERDGNSCETSSLESLGNGTLPFPGEGSGSRRDGTLENRIEELKSAKANLLKKQKDDAKRQRDISKTKTRELQEATRRERSARKTVLKLEAENQRLKALMERGKARNIKLSNKLKDTETNLKQALATRRSNSVQGLFEDVESEALSPTSRTIDSIKHLLDKSVMDKVALSQNWSVYKSKVELQQSLLQSIIVEANTLTKLGRHEVSMNSEPSGEALAENEYHKDNVQDLSIQLELLENSIDELRAKFPCLKDKTNGKMVMDNVFSERDSVMKVISKLHFRDLRAILLNFLSSSYHPTYVFVVTIASLISHQTN